MPRAKKPPGTAADPRNGQRADLALVTGTLARFNPPRGLSLPARQAWSAFWDDRPALLLTPSGKVVLLRWIDALDRYLRTTGEADEQPIVSGSTGQQVPNPLYKIAEQALRTVEACEKQLGIGGLNASTLGLAAITERRSLSDMNARYAPDGGDGHDRRDDDPRVRIVES